MQREVIFNRDLEKPWTVIVINEPVSGGFIDDYAHRFSSSVVLAGSNAGVQAEVAVENCDEVRAALRYVRSALYYTTAANALIRGDEQAYKQWCLAQLIKIEHLLTVARSQTTFAFNPETVALMFEQIEQAVADAADESWQLTTALRESKEAAQTTTA